LPDALTIAAQGTDVVTIDVLEAAQRIAGVSFTRPEQEAILTRLNAATGHRAGSAALRAARLRDDEPPAIVFNPVPPGKVLPSGRRGVVRRAPDISRPSTSLLDVPFGWDATSDVRNLRVGYLRSAFAAQPDEAARRLASRRNNEAALQVIRGMGVQVVPFDLPDVEIAAIDFIRWAETAAAFDEPTRAGTLRQIEDGPEKSTRPADIRAGRFIPAVEYIQANRYRLRAMERMDAAMAGLDLFLGSNPLLTNRLGHPILTVPSGFFEGSPTALHMTGKLFGEPELLLLAHAFQSRTDHHSKHSML
jgi:Asp-tRNA(Asn)/Glu-tRNA(Gln) amidotransferase A subunit family amidase